MQASQVPARFPIPFADSAAVQFVRDIPQASQQGITPGAASLTDGFPPANFVPVGAGGIPPFGADMNGVLRQATAWCRWVATGGPIQYDAGFSGSIGGYPAGAILGSASIAGTFWRSTAENNGTNPDAGGAGWVTRDKQPTYTTISTTGTGTYVPKAGCVRIEGRMVGAGGGGGATGGSAGSGALCSFGGWTALGGGGGQNNGNSPLGGQTGATGSGTLIYRNHGANGVNAAVSETGYSGSLNGPGQAGAASPFGGGGSYGNGPSNDAVNPGTGGGGGGVGNTQNASSGAAGEYVEFVWPAPFPASIPYVVPPGGLKASGNSVGGPGTILLKELYA